MRYLKRIRDNKGFSIILLISSITWIFTLSLFIFNSNTSRNEIISIESQRAMSHYESVLHNIFDQLNNIEVFTETVGVNELTDEKFNEYIEISEFENIGFISLSIAPAGIIEYYYAEDYSESLVGLNLIDDDREYVQEAVEYAIQNDVIVVNGPFILIQGGNGLVFRKAVYEDGDFVAIINLVIGYENLNIMFDDSSSDVVDLGIYDKENNLIFGTLKYNNDLDFYQEINLEHIDWHVGVKETKDHILVTAITNITIIMLSVVLYTFVVIIGTKFYRSNKILILEKDNLIFYDNLTALPNRRLLTKDLNEAIEIGETFYLGFGDLDNFKNLNDILGHSVGDIYLEDISKKFQNITNENLRIYRWGGDEFIFLFKAKTKKEAISLLDTIYNVFKKPIIIKETNYQVSMSIGVVCYPIHGNTIDDLIKRADIVMYDIKSQRKNNYGFFEDKYLDNLQREVDFENKVNRYNLNDFEVFLQPVVSTVTNEITGFEALSRLFDDGNNLINTQEVIRVYERKGDIFKLDKYIFEQTCKHSNKIRKEFKKDFSYSFNISPITLSNEYIIFLKQMIKKHSINPKNFIIEIIETTGFKDINESIRLLKKLRELGFRIAMDDFGMGYSSLSYITRLPLSLIKIDRNFVHNYQTNEFDKMLILTIRDISKSLNIEIVVEGIESEEQLDFIKDIGAHYYQGYLHSKPMRCDDIIKIIKKE